MSLQTKTYEQYLSDIVTTWASILFLSPNLQSGDPLLAIFQAHTLGGLMFLQSQVVEVNRLTRAKTSEGADLDSWMDDFSFARKPATFAGGIVQFSVRNVSSAAIQIKPGVVIQTKDNAIQYVVIEDDLLSAWSTEQQAYILPSGELQVNVRVKAVLAGKASNVQAGALTQIASAVTGIHFVTNLEPFLNGADAELDQPFRDRFKLYINAVNARTTPTGILSQALNIPGVTEVSLIENQDQFGNPRPGYGVVVIDDGSGDPPQELIDMVAAQVSSTWAPVRGFTIQSLVIGPTKVLAEITLNVKVAPGAVAATVKLAVKNAILNHVNTRGIGETLYLENLSYIAKAADPNVIAVEANSIMINDDEADLEITNIQVIRTNTQLVVIGDFT